MEGGVSGKENLEVEMCGLVTIGIAMGLTAAFMHSVCYVISGSYVKRTRLPGWTLVAPQRVVMCIPYAALAWFFRPVSYDGHGVPLLVCALVCMMAVFLGDCGLFQMQRHVEPSRTAPLQAVKIPILAFLLAVVFGHDYTVMQIAGIFMVLVSALLLCDAGTRIPRMGWAWLFLSTGCYAVSDIAIGHALIESRDVCGGVLKASLFILGMTHLACSLFAMPILVAQRLTGRAIPNARQWFLYALPYGFAWLVAMIFLLVCFSLSGVVLGAVAQSCRGLMSVALGWFLASRGFVDLEGMTTRSVFVRRAVAALFMVIAMILYASR